MKRIFELITRPFRNIFRALFKEPVQDGLSEDVWNQIDDHFGIDDKPFPDQP